MTRDEVIEMSRRIVSDPGQWPRWPFLPLKKPVRVGFPECRVILATENHYKKKVSLFDIDFFHPPLKEGPKGKTLDIEEIEKSLKEEYPDIEALLADGWVVD